MTHNHTSQASQPSPTTSSGFLTGVDAAAGPLVVSTTNPRYFTVASAGRKVIYLTGSHIWNNFHDGMGPGAECAETAEPLDYDAYLEFLKQHGHNFIRVARCDLAGEQVAPVVSNQVQLKAIEPAHARFATGSNACKDLVLADTLIHQTASDVASTKAMPVHEPKECWR